MDTTLQTVRPPNIIAEIAVPAITVGSARHIAVNYPVHYVPAFQEPRLRVAAVQPPATTARVPQDNRAHAVAVVEQLYAGLPPELRPNLVVFPEMSVTGGILLEGDGQIGNGWMGATEYLQGNSYQSFSSLARATGMYIGYGFLRRAEKGEVYNSYAFVSPRARFDNGEDILWIDKFEGLILIPSSLRDWTWRFNGLKIGTLICMNAKAETLVRPLLSEKPDLVLVPARAHMESTFVAYYKSLFQWGYRKAFLSINADGGSTFYSDGMSPRSPFSGMDIELDPGTLHEGPGILLAEVA